MGKIVRQRALTFLGLLAIVSGCVPSRAPAHENHQQEQVEELDNAIAPAPAPMRQAMAEHRDAMEAAARAGRPWPERLLNWAGRVHPFAVHFPIALIPVSLLALILARRRRDPTQIVRALIILAGVSAIVAASLGWLDGGFLLTDRNPIKLWHRWLGTGLGAAGALLAIWAWRRPAVASGRPMMAALGLLTLALLGQGWLGGAMVHGIHHLHW
jgi:uncharacterized membrane protein